MRPSSGVDCALLHPEGARPGSSFLLLRTVLVSAVGGVSMQLTSILGGFRGVFCSPLNVMDPRDNTCTLLQVRVS